MSVFKGVIVKGSAPTVNDDISKGFYVGFDWVDSVGEKSYTIVDSTIGAAVWKDTTSGGNTLYSSDDTVGASRIATLTDTLTWSGGRTIHLNNARTSTLNSTNLVEVKEPSDLPATLVADTTYLVRGSITLSTPISVVNEGCVIIGIDRNKDKLIWDGLTGTTMLTVTDVDFGLSNLCLSSNNTGAVIIEADNYDGAGFNSGRTKVFTIDSCQFRNCFDVASFEGFDLIDISNTLFWYIEAPNFGVKFLNTSKTEISSCEFIRWFDESSIPTPSGYATCPMIEFLANGGGSGLGAVNIGGCVIHPQQTQDGIKINSGSTTGFGTISANTFVDVNLTTGLKFFPDPLTGGYSDTECLNYDIAVNQGIPNSSARMLCTFTGNTNDTDLSSGVPAPIEGNNLATATSSQRFTLTNTTIGASVSVTPVLEYIGTKDIFLSVATTLSYDKQGGGIDEYRFSYYMDTGSGYVQLTDSEIIIDAGSDSDELTIPMLYGVNFSAGDKLAIFVENPSSGDDMLIKSIQWLIKE